jgi:hypothetical protein
MSFDLFVQSFDAGESKPFAKSMLRERLNTFIVGEEPEYHLWHVSFGQGDGGDFFVSEVGQNSETLDGFTVSRPLTGLKLYDFLFSLLSGGQFVLYFPGSPPVIGRPETVHDLPTDMRQSLGEPILVRGGREIVELIKKS